MCHKDYTFKKINRLKDKREFQQLYHTGRAVVDAMSVWYVSKGNVRQIGLAVGKKLGNAVLRNHVKRLMREVFRLHQAKLQEGCRIVWVARHKLTTGNLPAYERVFFRMARKAGLLKEEA